MKWLITLIIKWFHIETCEKCGSWNLQKGHYTSGWNYYCQQASGHNGVICKDCIHVKFDEPLSVRQAKDPSWVRTLK